jgi:hypothetical protein
MELDRYYELRTLLQRWLRRLADNIRNRIEANNTSLQRLETLYDQEGVGEEFTLWLDRWCRQAAIQFILRILFLRVLEDRNLLGTIRLRSSDGQQMWQQLTRNLGAAHYVQWCCWDAAHLLPDPRGGSASKRLVLFLRWMVRPADGVDLGLWPVEPARLEVGNAVLRDHAEAGAKLQRTGKTALDQVLTQRHWQRRVGLFRRWAR